MIIHDRHQYLLKRLEQDGSIQIARIHEELGVTTMTIWRDLQLMEKKGLLKRVHGGAVSLGRSDAEQEFQSKEQNYAAEKRRIAAYAARGFVKQGDTIIVEGGTTAAEILNHLNMDKLTLMTNSLPILARAHALRKPWHLHGSGGVLSPVSGNFVGAGAISFFNSKHAQTFFMSATGLDVDLAQVTDPNPVEIDVKRKMADCAQQVVLLLDSSKVGLRSVQEVLSLQRITALITDTGIESQALLKLRKMGLRVEVC